MDRQTSSNAQPAGSGLRGLFVLALVLVAGVFIQHQLPKGSCPTNLSRIEQVKAAPVLTMNGNFMPGMQMMPVLDTLREEFGGQAHFLVASKGLPEGQAFALQNQTADGSVVVFDPCGTRMAVLCGPRTAEELPQVLQLALQP